MGDSQFTSLQLIRSAGKYLSLNLQTTLYLDRTELKLLLIKRSGFAPCGPVSGTDVKRKTVIFIIS